MALAFSKEAEGEFSSIVSRYPNTRAALLPTLFLAQRDFGGYLSVEAMEYVAERLELEASQVLNVASFYTMYNKRPVGEYHVQVCVSISCALLGAHRVLHYLEEKLECRVGETSADGRYTLSEVECLAACGTALAVQINDDYYENLKPNKQDIDRLIDGLE